MVSTRDYRQEWDEKVGGYQIHSEEICVCPLCSGLLCRYGKRCRGVIESSGEKLPLVIRRLKCKLCGAIHHELPDIVVPYKRYGTEAVEKIIAGDTDDVACEVSTIRRIWAWWYSCRLYFESIIASLRAKYGARFSACPAPREMFRAAVNAQLWPSTRSVFLPG